MTSSSAAPSPRGQPTLERTGSKIFGSEEGGGGEGWAKSKRASIRALLRRSTTVSREERSGSVVYSIVGESGSGGGEERKINYQPLARLLVKKDFQLPQILWDLSSISEGELISKFLVKLYVAEGCGASCLKLLIEDEVKRNNEDSTLFRANNMSPKFISEYSQYVGREYLIAVLRPLILQMVSSQESLEVDDNKLQDEDAIRENQRKLIKTCEQWFDAIAATIDICPLPIRCACSLLKTIVGAKFPSAASISVGGLFFLRFIAPVIVAPERLKIVDKPLSSLHRRNLILVSKVLQNLSNNVPFGKKEAFMEPINEFIENYRPHMLSLQNSLAVCFSLFPF